MFDPDPTTIDINDIAHALANTCRFGGHTYKFYSVAQHCCKVTERTFFQRDKLAALLHDASEAYLCDLPRPIKQQLSHYRELEEKLMIVIAAKFDFEYPLPRDVDQNDVFVLRDEYSELMESHTCVCWTPEEAKERFLELYEVYRVKAIPGQRYFLQGELQRDGRFIGGPTGVFLGRTIDGDVRRGFFFGDMTGDSTRYFGDRGTLLPGGKVVYYRLWQGFEPAG